AVERQDLRVGIERHAEAPLEPPRARAAQLDEPGDGRVARHLGHRRAQRLADELGRALARIADAEVDRLDPRRAQRVEEAVELHDRVLLPAREGGMERPGPRRAHDWVRNSASHWYAVSRLGTGQYSPAWCACSGMPGPKLNAGMPAAVKRATSVQPC